VRAQQYFLDDRCKRNVLALERTRDIMLADVHGRVVAWSRRTGCGRLTEKSEKVVDTSRNDGI